MCLSSQLSTNEAPRVFPNTQWSVVLAARQRSSPESAAALEAICLACWYPLYAYVRRHASQFMKVRVDNTGTLPVIAKSGQK